MKDIVLMSITKEELSDLLRQIVREEIANLKPTEVHTPIKLYTRKEVSEMLGITLPTLHEWTKEGIIKAHRIGTRVRYKEEDVQKALSEVQHHKFRKR